MLATLLPIIFPIAKPESLFNEAITEEANSGREVPIATTVKPITNSDTPNILANLEAETTNKSLLLINTKSPKTKSKKYSII